MANRWNIPADLEREIEVRDQSCIYCHQAFASATKRGQRRSWEHIINDAALVSRENVALCCISCNASKGVKLLTVWLESRYCRSRGIHAGSIAPVARAAVRAAIGSAQSAAFLFVNQGESEPLIRAYLAGLGLPLREFC